jgi:hypothetical protein
MRRYGERLRFFLISIRSSAGELYFMTTQSSSAASVGATKLATKGKISGERVVVGVFTYFDDAVKAIKRVQSEELDYRVYSPVPHHELEDLVTPESSPMTYFTGLGAIFGLVGGFTLAIWTSLDYPLRVSAKAIPSIPGFVVIGYECTILFGGIATLLGLLTLCRIPYPFREVGFHPSFTQDKFGVVVGCLGDKAFELKAAFEVIGADEVQVREGF